MKSKTYLGAICLDFNSITYYVCNLSYTIFEDETFEYKFTPNYFVIDLLDNHIFQGIPGLNLDTREEVYYRKNVVPTFISERVPQKNREDLDILLKEANIEYLNPINYLLNTKTRYGGDNFYLKPFHMKELIDMDNKVGKNNTFGLIKTILNHLAAGDNIIYNSSLIDDVNRKAFFNVLYALYQKSLSSRYNNQIEGIKKAKSENKYKGRKPINVDLIIFKEYLSKIETKQITVKECCRILNISTDKFYRVKKTLIKN